ncbi:MAG: ABC transporter permease [Chthonomonas sp.]|nr:ABC transporter permease [Chthonomonas sp.]
MILRNLGEAFRNAREQWQRAVLTALGVMVGVVAITLLIGIGRGVRADMTQQVKDLGVNLLVVFPARIDPSALAFNPNMGGMSYLKHEDSQRIERVQGVVRASVLSFTGGGVRAGEKEAYPINIAAEPDWFSIRPVTLKEGKLFTSENESQAVAVLGSIAAEELFGKGSALGKEVTINGKPYQIIGITEDLADEKSLFSEFSFQNVAYVPWAGFKKLNPQAQIDRIMVQTEPNAEPKALTKQIETTLGQRLDEQQYSVFTQDQLLGLIYRMMSILEILVTGLTSIALFVGGVGIMAIMLMAVNERSREIGIRKTYGARRADVFVLFLFEAIIISLVGGGAGLLLSMGVSWVLATYTAVKPEISNTLVLFSLGISTAVGIVFGLVPAMNAARKNPVEAMRSE